MKPTNPEATCAEGDFQIQSFVTKSIQFQIFK